MAAILRDKWIMGGQKNAHILSHDWGSPVASAIAGIHPELLRSLIFVNGPHMQGVPFRTHAHTRARTHNEYDIVSGALLLLLTLLECTLSMCAPHILSKGRRLIVRRWSATRVMMCAEFLAFARKSDMEPICTD